MTKYVSILLAAALSCTASLASGQQSTVKIRPVPIQKTSPVSGAQMYSTYCAVCHGADGKGNGPAAPALKTIPTNLTTLAKKNNGKFPAEHVSAVLQFGVATPAHGNADMPIWGDLMRTLPSSSMQLHQRIVNLTDYLKTMQN